MQIFTSFKFILSAIVVLSIVGVALAFWGANASDKEINYDETYTTEQDFEQWLKENWHDSSGKIPDAALKPLGPDESWCDRIPEENRTELLQLWTQMTYARTKIYIPPTC